MNRESEGDAVIARYARRPDDDRYSMLRPEVWMSTQELERKLLQLLRQRVRKPLSEVQLLEVGCGTGGNLLEFVRIGLDARNLVGSELIPERVAAARRRLPNMLQVYEGDACNLSLATEVFDIVYVSLVFSSLLDDRYQEQLALRIWDWVRPGGAVLWYDFTINNPRNADVRGIAMSRVRRLFPKGRLVKRRVTLAPPFARRVAALHPSLYTVFNLVPLLRTHLLCWIEKT